jgi:hypothetical protein
LAPLPLDSTARYHFQYHTCGFDHTLQIRAGADVTDAEVAADFNAFITACGGLFHASTLTDVLKAPSGSNVFNSVVADWPVGWGGSAGPNAHTANYVDFIGRSLDGRRVRAALFGCTFDVFEDSYRILAADDAAVADTCTVLNGAEGTFVSINGFQPVWKLYADIGPSAYWRNKIR